MGGGGGWCERLVGRGGNKHKKVGRSVEEEAKG